MNRRENEDLPFPASDLAKDFLGEKSREEEARDYHFPQSRPNDKSKTKPILVEEQQERTKHYKQCGFKFAMEDAPTQSEKLDLLLEEYDSFVRRMNEFYVNLPLSLRNVVERIHRDGMSFEEMEKDRQLVLELSILFAKRKIKDKGIVTYAYGVAV